MEHKDDDGPATRNIGVLQRAVDDVRKYRPAHRTGTALLREFLAGHRLPGALRAHRSTLPRRVLLSASVGGPVRRLIQRIHLSKAAVPVVGAGIETTIDVSELPILQVSWPSVD